MNIIDVIVPVYNGQETIVKCVDSIKRQQLPADWRVNIIIVDDASNDRTYDLVTDHYGDCITLIRNKNNAGRARTRNAGARTGEGMIVVFLDCDCSFENDFVLNQYMELIDSGTDCVFANIISRENDFTARYLNDIARRRRKAADAGNFLEMTSASFAIRRSLLDETGGFCEEYISYGFEDRDFIASLIKQDARLAVDNKCLVYHDDRIDLSALSKKLIACARDSAPVYFRNHPQIYSASVYGKIDPRSSKYNLKVIYSGMVILLPAMIKLFQPGLGYSFIPYAIRKIFVKTVSFLSYIKGCLDQPVINKPC